MLTDELQEQYFDSFFAYLKYRIFNICVTRKNRKKFITHLRFTNFLARLQIKLNYLLFPRRSLGCVAYYLAPRVETC